MKSSDIPSTNRQIKNLIFSPHIDDEALGCFSFLTPDTHVLYCGVEDRPGMPGQMRIKELERSSAQLGFSWELLDNVVNHYQATDLIAPMEAMINTHRPDTVLIPEPSYNQDHRSVYDAGIIATRPHDSNWFVSNVLIFEQPHSVMWPHSSPVEPNVFIEIDIEAKLQAYQLYASQVRGHRSPETLTAMATLRGAQIGRSHAEGFRAKRIVKNYKIVDS